MVLVQDEAADVIAASFESEWDISVRSQVQSVASDTAGPTMLQQLKEVFPNLVDLILDSVYFSNRV